jgi:hypothetical protein
MYFRFVTDFFLNAPVIKNKNKNKKFDKYRRTVTNLHVNKPGTRLQILSMLDLKQGYGPVIFLDLQIGSLLFLQYPYPIRIWVLPFLLPNNVNSPINFSY